MGRFLYPAVLMVLLSGCVGIASDPARDEFGLSTARADAGTAAPGDTDAAKLAWKASQICVRDYAQTKQDIEPAEASKQMIDMKLRCGHYDRMDFDYVHISWSNLL